jgi:hypothetical protein
MIRKLALLAPARLAGCAVVQAPGGGPVDSVAVQVVRSFPAAGAVNVPRTSDLEIEWSKWVDPGSLGKALNISPTPPGRIKIVPDGARVRFSFGEPLDSPATYAVRFSPGIKDYHDGVTRQELEISFATGPRLDSGLVEVLAVLPGAPPKLARSGVRVGLYPLDSVRRSGLKRLLRKRDSLAWLALPPRPWREKPLFSATADSMGVAHVRHVPPGRYLVAACTDKSGDGFCRQGSDSGAVAGSLDWSAGTGTWRAAVLLGRVDTGTSDSAKRHADADTTGWTQAQRDSCRKADSLARRDSLQLDSLAARDTVRPSDSLAVVTMADSLLSDSLHPGFRPGAHPLWARAWPLGLRTRPVLRPFVSGRARLPLKPGRWRLEVWQDDDGDGRPTPSDLMKGNPGEATWLWKDREFTAGFDGVP